MSNPNPNKDNLKPPFTSDNQPTPEQIQTREEKKKQRRKLKSFIRKYRKYKLGELLKIQEDMLKNPDNYLADEYIALNSVIKMAKDYRYYKDERDREEGEPVKPIKHSGKINYDDIPVDELKKIRDTLSKYNVNDE